MHRFDMVEASSAGDLDLLERKLISPVEQSGSRFDVEEDIERLELTGGS
jgi:hypothetical protein